MHNETVWLIQSKIAELFGVKRPAITKHLRNIFESKEVDENSVSSILEITEKDLNSTRAKIAQVQNKMGRMRKLCKKNKHFMFDFLTFNMYH